MINLGQKEPMTKCTCGNAHSAPSHNLYGTHENSIPFLHRDLAAAPFYLAVASNSGNLSDVYPKKGHTTVGVYLTGIHFTNVHLVGGCLIGASHWRASHGHVSHGRVPYRRHLHLIGVYLTGVHLMGVYLITLCRGCTATGDIAGSCLQGCGQSGSAPSLLARPSGGSSLVADVET